MSPAASFSVDDLWIGRSLGPVVVAVEGTELRPVAFGAQQVARAGVPHLRGAVLPGVLDAHVHLGLVDGSALADSAVVEVRDLGWIPDEARRWRRDPPTGVRVQIAGAFLTAVGGYPYGRSWAPNSAVWQLPDRRAAIRAVEAAAAHRHDMVKVVLHAGGPNLDTVLLRTVVAAARGRHLPVVVHAEGPGQARRAFDAGADQLVHAPWTERLDDRLIRDMARSMTWVSTLTIHAELDRQRALDNLRRFVRFGGTVLYGTDLGNGPGPVGVRVDEIAALGRSGLAEDALLGALTGWGRTTMDLADAVYAAAPVPRTAEEAGAWFPAAERLTHALEQEAA